MEKMGETNYAGPLPYDSRSDPGYQLEHGSAAALVPATHYVLPIIQQPMVPQQVTAANDSGDSVPLIQSFVSHIILACFTIWCCGCGCICGLAAFILAGHFTM